MRAGVLAGVALAAACARPDGHTDSTSTGASAAVSPIAAATISVTDFQQLRWINGMWRGFMPDGKTFYERYRVVNDSTMVMHAFPDSTFGTPSDSSVIALRNGIVTSDGGNSRYVATRLDSTGVDFAPQRGATNRFTWAKETPTQWSATLRFTDRDGRPQTVVYALHKFGR
jgi:hypothetical protein